MLINRFIIIPDSMVGDVNFFFNEDENKSSAEIEIMIAGMYAK